MNDVNEFMGSMNLVQNIVFDMYKELQTYLVDKRIKYKVIDDWDENDMPVFVYHSGTVTRLTFYECELTIIVKPDGKINEHYLGMESHIEVIE